MNLRCRRYHRKHWHYSQRKHKKQNALDPKHPGNPGQNEKTKPRKEIRSHTNRIQEIEERISGAEDTIVNIDTIIKENAKCKNLLTQNIQEIQETISKSQRETTLEIENLGKRSGVIHASIKLRIKEIEERISGAEDTIENIDTTVKENAKSKKLVTQNIQEIQDTMRKPNLRIIGIDESKIYNLKGQQISTTEYKR